MRTNLEPGRSFANELDYQLRLDDWCEKVNARVHRTTRAVVAERLAEERERMPAAGSNAGPRARRASSCLRADRPSARGSVRTGASARHTCSLLKGTRCAAAGDRS
jgi:hypothetical protein